MDLIGLLLTLVVLTDLFLAFIIYSRATKNRLSLSFSFVIFSVVLWSVSIFIYRISDRDLVGIWSRILYLSASLIPSTFLFFTSIFPGKDKFNTWHPTAIFLPNIILAILILTTDLIIVKAEKVPYAENKIIFGPLFFLYTLYIIGFFYLSYSNLFHTYRKYVGQTRIQALYILSAGFIPGNTAFLTNLLLPWMGIFYLNWVGQVATLIMASLITYAIVKHRLLDIRFIVARTVAYVTLVLLIAAFYTSTTFIISSYLLGTTLESNQLLISIFLTLIIALTFQPLRKFLEHATDKVFFKGAYDSNTLLNNLTKIMASTLFLSELTHKLLKELLDQMRISRGVFILTEAGKIFDIEAHGFREPPKFNSIDLLSLMEEDKTLIFDELEEGNLKDLMRKLDITIAAPLRSGNEEIGILLLGEKLSGDIYSDQDLKLLEILTPEASVAIQNAKSYEEIRRFNITLKEEIAKATKELKVSNIKLEELDKLKDEFISVTSHDLRTPMTAIKYYLWLILHGKAKTEQKVNDYLKRSYTSSERMITLINDLLNVSRIESGRIQLNLVPTDLAKVINEMIDEIMSKATEKQITLSFTPPKEKPPLVLADAERFPEVLTNLIGNAIKFTPNGGKVSVSTQLKDKEVGISISDTGVGIRKEDRHKLFTKFGRLDSSYVASATQGGTGLGLYITKNLVELHGGKIWVESQVGKGTTFTFTVKVASDDDLQKAKSQPVKPEGVFMAPPA